MANLAKIESRNEMLFTPEAGQITYTFSENDNNAIVILVKKSDGTFTEIGENKGAAATADTLTIKDVGNYYTSTTVEGVLQEIGATLNGLEAELAEI